MLKAIVKYIGQPFQKSLIDWLETDNLKWKCHIRESSFRLDKVPYCLKHDIKLSRVSLGWRCPSSHSSKEESCNIDFIHQDELEGMYDTARSLGDKELRKKGLTK